ncbi:sensor domain-containing protein [Deinococcus humi]|uniref:Diguanylate cyclase (GGDEF)-like protein/PAS domain S-box-containing protein n=1 Tax=Deinococcus humi TaxID=662880 RepID=A0A7W8JXC9_9DEIO|nr:EAL domain-containing protein [Deinococcus humi]MBB5363476.1 diguanylate cyclase (GGDEF)-like protein/PAS domain S-box-containing protein [Deinococcus humi]
MHHVPDEVMGDLAEGYMALDCAGQITYLNPAAEDWTGLRAERVLGTSVWEHLGTIDFRFRSVLQEAQASGRRVEFETYSAPRQEWRRTRIYPHPDGFRIVFHDLTERKRAEEYSLRLLTVSDLLARALTPSQVARAILEYAHATSEAYAGLVAVRHGNGAALETLEFVGYPPELVHDYQVMDLRASLPLTETFREQSPLYLARSALMERYPQLRLSQTTASVAIFPLIAGGESTGVLVFSFPSDQTFSTIQRGYLQGLATQCAQALARAQQHAELVRNTASSRVILDALDEGLLMFSSAGQLAAVNAAAQRFFEIPPSDDPQPKLDLTGWAFHLEDGTPLHLDDCPITSAFRTGASCEGTLIQATRPGGETRWVSVNARPLYHPGDSRPYASMASMTDVTRQKTYEQQLTRRATRDELTGLFNRQSFLDHVTTALQGVRRRRLDCAVLVLDLNRFRSINDAYGGVVGDAVLCEVAARLTTQAGPRVTIARLSGDEFGILLSPLLSQRDAELFAEKLLDVVGAPISAQGHELHFSANVGISVPNNDRVRGSTLVQQAYQALASAQQRQGSGPVTYDVNIAQVQDRQTEIEHKLRSALRDEQLTLAYQPIVDLQTERPVAIEALVRWQHPALGVISPAEFIPIAEQRGLILLLGEWVMNQACLTARTWDAVTVAVNVSRLQFNQPNFPEVVQRALLHSGLPASRLELEITETAMADDLDEGVKQLMKLKALGVRVALDDFGTGQSSLASLQRLPIDNVKLDRSFVAGCQVDDRQRAMVEAVITLAGALGIKVVAEGIELGAQRDVLRQMGCAYGQGNLFARPLPADQLNVFNER